MKHFQMIVDECGGIPKIAIALDITESTVRKWEKSGIPDRHWSRLMGLSVALSPVSLYLLNEAIRNSEEKNARDSRN